MEKSEDQQDGENVTIAPHFGDIMGKQTFTALPDGFMPIERIVLLANGNLQRVVSAFYNSKVTVRIRKNECVGEGLYSRVVELVCFDKVFCVAKSSVQIQDKKILAAIASNLVGIGQLFQFFSILPKFELMKAERMSNGGLYRHYSLEGDGIKCSIQETFCSDLLNLRPDKE